MPTLLCEWPIESIGKCFVFFPPIIAYTQILYANATKSNISAYIAACVHQLGENHENSDKQARKGTHAAAAACVHYLAGKKFIDRLGKCQILGQPGCQATHAAAAACVEKPHHWWSCLQQDLDEVASCGFHGKL